MATKTQQSGSSFVAIKISKAQAGAQQVRVHILYGRLCVHTKCLCQLNATSALMHHGERLKTVFPPERKGRAWISKEPQIVMRARCGSWKMNIYIALAACSSRASKCEAMCSLSVALFMYFMHMSWATRVLIFSTRCRYTNKEPPENQLHTITNVLTLWSKGAGKW